MQRAIGLASIFASVSIAAASACSTDDTTAPDDGGSDVHVDGRVGSNDSGANDGAPNIDSGMSNDSGTPTFDAGDWSEAGSCNALVGSAPFVERRFVAANQPPPTGGSLDPGTYELTSINDYTGDGGVTGGSGEFTSDTWIIATVDAGLFEIQRAEAMVTDAGLGKGRSSIGLTLNGGISATFYPQCPSSPIGSIDFIYSASGTGAGATFEYTLSAPRIYTMTKQ
ncbi:MAG: hypothetical protein ACRELY_04690 [Polyangiaceae bacterium]